MMPEIRALMEQIKTPEHTRRIHHFEKKYVNRYKAEETADAEFILKWRRKQKRLESKAVRILKKMRKIPLNLS